MVATSARLPLGIGSFKSSLRTPSSHSLGFAQISVVDSYCNFFAITDKVARRSFKSSLRCVGRHLRFRLLVNRIYICVDDSLTFQRKH